MRKQNGEDFYFFLIRDWQVVGITFLHVMGNGTISFHSNISNIFFCKFSNFIPFVFVFFFFTSKFAWIWDFGILTYFASLFVVLFWVLLCYMIRYLQEAHMIALLTPTLGFGFMGLSINSFVDFHLQHHYWDFLFNFFMKILYKYRRVTFHRTWPNRGRLVSVLQNWQVHNIILFPDIYLDI